MNHVHVRLDGLCMVLIILSAQVILLSQSPNVFGAEDPSKKTGEYQRISSEETFPGTTLLSPEKTVEDIILYEQMESFIDSELRNAEAVRAANWPVKGLTRDNFDALIKTKRELLKKMAGAVDTRMEPTIPWVRLNEEAGSTVIGPFQILNMSWPVFDDYNAEGIMIEPRSGNIVKTEIVVPHAGMAPLDFFNHTAWLQKMANEGNRRLIIPAIVGREKTPPANGRGPMSARHYLNWTAFELGRHIIGYDVQTIFALVDWLKSVPETQNLPIRVAGYGDGGLAALYAAALDTRIDEVYLAGHFNTRQEQWKEPQDRNVFGLLNEFCDAELALMVYPRPLMIESGRGPAVTFEYPPTDMPSPDPANVQKELDRAKALLPDFDTEKNWIHLVRDEEKQDLGSYTPDEDFSSADRIEYQQQQKRIINALDRHNQKLLTESKFERIKFMSKLDFTSLEAYEKSLVPYRRCYYEEIIGKFDKEFSEFNAKSRLTYDEPKWTGYDVLIDVFPGFSVGGILLMPKDIQPGEQRPVVVFQHGKSGRFDSSLKMASYNSISPLLAESGFIVFSCQGMTPANWFRVPCRKANCIGKSLYSMIIPQHQQLINWLKTLPCVAPDKIALYGLSYGGRTAMRVPPVVTDYCLSISSADFSNWAIRAASPREPYSFVGTAEYETNDFNLANHFSHAEMAALIAPRPFMVERGLQDLCGDNENIGGEYAKVRMLYTNQLKIPERTKIEWLDGGHCIHAKGTVQFLKDNLMKGNTK